MPWNKATKICTKMEFKCIVFVCLFIYLFACLLVCLAFIIRVSSTIDMYIQTQTHTHTKWANFFSVFLLIIYDAKLPTFAIKSLTIITEICNAIVLVVLFFPFNLFVFLHLISPAIMCYVEGMWPRENRLQLSDFWKALYAINGRQ